MPTLLLRRSATPPPGKTGRPRRHGAKFNCADPITWPTPTATLVTTDDQYGTVTVQAWGGLHPKQHRHPGHGTRGPRPIVRGTVVRVQVERVPARTRPPKVLWLWWAGSEGLQLDLDLAWRAYIRRFDLEHTVRFAKQTLAGPPRVLGIRAGRPVDLAGAGRLHPVAPGPRGGRGCPAAVGAAPAARAAVTGAGLPRVSATFGTAGFPGGHAETRRALPRPAQGQQLRARHAVSGHQEVRQEAQNKQTTATKAA